MGKVNIEIVNDFPILDEFFNKRLPSGYRLKIPERIDGQDYIPSPPNRFASFILIKMVKSKSLPPYITLARIYINGFNEVEIDIRDKYFDELEPILSPIILAHREALKGRSYIKLIKRVIPE